MEPWPPIGQGRFMINPEEDLPRPTRKLLIPPVLDMLGVEELTLYKTGDCGQTGAPRRRRGVFQGPAKPLKKSTYPT
jgi:hypothetical protein